MESEEVTGSPKECETRVTDGADHSISLQENKLSGKLQSLERATDVRTLKSSNSEEFGLLTSGKGRRPSLIGSSNLFPLAKFDVREKWSFFSAN